MMLNQNLLKGVFSPSRATPSTSFDEDCGLEDLNQRCYELIIPKYTQETQTKTEDISTTTASTTPTSTQIPQPKPRHRVRGQSFTPEYYRSTKNVAKNYGKAIASFACSELAVPYLEKILEKEKCSPAEFMEYIRRNKEMIQGIDSFRAMLLPRDHEDLREIAFKRAFQQMSEVFIKCFSVNWICHGKMKDKLIYLKFRFKILRRIRSPELFTYLKKPKKKTQQQA